MTESFFRDNLFHVFLSILAMPLLLPLRGCDFWPVLQSTSRTLSIIGLHFWGAPMSSILTRSSQLSAGRLTVCFSAGTSRLWELRWRSVCLRRNWNSLLSASVPLLSWTPTLKPAQITASSTTILKVITAHAATMFTLCTFTPLIVVFCLFHSVCQSSALNNAEFGFAVKNELQ